MTNLIRKKTFDEKLSEIGRSYNNQNYNLVKKVPNNCRWATLTSSRLNSGK